MPTTFPIHNVVNPAYEPIHLTFERIAAHIREDVDTLPEFPVTIDHVSTVDIEDGGHRLTIVRLTGVTSWHGEHPDLASSSLRAYFTFWGLRASIERVGIALDDSFGGDE